MFEDLNKHPWESGDLLIGYHGSKANGFYPVGVKTERHALTIAGAGSGKGVAVIIPNLKLWPHNALTIDPKGEAAEETAADRERMGQKVYVVDPFHSANIPDRFRATYNPLSRLNPASLTIKEDIEVIADGLVSRTNPEADFWDNGAVAIIGGVIAYVLLYLSPEKQNLIEVRRILRSDERLKHAAKDMADDERCAGMMQDAESAMHAKEGGYFVSGAKRHTKWLDSDAMKWALSSSSFELSELKTAKASVYLVLPANYLGQHGRFLRLFVRCAIDEMARKIRGRLRDAQCLFFLDEFFAIGYIDEIAKAAGLMRGYGLQMWAIMQDYGQLLKLYGREGADTFFGNADLHQFFGNMDATTLNYISRELGKENKIDIEEYFPPPVLEEPKWWWPDDYVRLKRDIYDAELQSHVNTVWHYEGTPRMHADKVADFVSKKGQPVTDKCICFTKGRKVLMPKPLAYFQMDGITWGKKPDVSNKKKQQVIKDIKTNERTNVWNIIKFCFFTIGGGFLIGKIFIENTTDFHESSGNKLLGTIISISIAGLISFHYIYRNKQSDNKKLWGKI